ncbi:hypothetical protein OUZ56_025393 [Daphnia magna]|uniref:Uncharacterized protein n=1 Tax=Daphnia magna TaxID=35525 RepID=A0ABQ9ZJQ8_9CRUS|nr:hypothetical protein OUZ56_025393 [Daphnia magna]
MLSDQNPYKQHRYADRTVNLFKTTDKRPKPRNSTIRKKLDNRQGSEIISLETISLGLSYFCKKKDKLPKLRNFPTPQPLHPVRISWCGNVLLCQHWKISE